MEAGSVVIAGAGIGGLSAALALCEAGARVTVIERAPALEEAGAGVQISPNASRILARAGLLDQIRAAALAPRAIHVRRGRDGTTLQHLPLDDAEARWGSPYLLVHRADLQAALARAVAARPGIALDLDTRFERFETDGDGVRVHAVARGVHRVDRADGLVGADGLRSAVRQRLWPDAAPPHAAGRTAWRATIPIEAVPRALRAPEAALWLGVRSHVVHYPLRGGRVVNVVAILEDDRSAGADDTGWSAPGRAGTLLEAFAGWDEAVRRLLAGAPDWRTWPLFDLAPLPRWSRGPATLLGDAAHAALPFLAQGAAQAIEDAAALERAWRAAPTTAAAFAAYETARRDRSSRVQAMSRQQGRIYHLGGAAALARDATMRILGGRRTLARYDWLYDAA